MRTDDWYKAAQQEASLGPRIVQRNYALGMNTVDDDRDLAGQMRSIKGLFIDKMGRAYHTGGVTNLFTSKDISDFGRYHREPDALTAAAIDKLIVVEVDYAAGTSGNIWAYNESTFAFTNLLSSYNAAIDDQVCLLQVDDRMYCTSKLNLLDYDGTGTFVNAGIFAPSPTATPTVAVIGAIGSGNLDSETAGLPYAYIYTWTDAHGQTSNPSDPPTASFHANNQNAQLNFDTAVGEMFTNGIITATTSGTALGTIDVYRTGGTSTTYTWVGSFAPKTTGGGVLQDTATSARWIDSTLNRDIGSILPVYSRNLPPQGLCKIFHHLGRIMGFGQSAIQAVADQLISPAALWMSRPNEPWAWGSDDNGVDDDGGFLLIDANDRDGLLDAVSTGSLAILGRRESVYALYGEGFTNFRAVQISNKGVASRRSMVREGNIVRYFGADGIFYEVANDEPKRLSDSIRDKFDAFTDTELATSVVWQHRSRLYVSVRRDDTTVNCYYYDLLTQSWADMSNQPAYLVRQAKSLTPIGGGRPLLFSAGRATNPGLRRLMTSTATDTPYYIETPYIAVMDSEDEWKMLEFTLEGAFTAGATATTVTFTFKTVAGDISYTLPLTRTSGSLLKLTKPPANVTGYMLKITIQGSLTAGYIGGIMWRWKRVRGGQ